MKKFLLEIVALTLVAGFLFVTTEPVSAQNMVPSGASGAHRYQLQRLYYYPYYYFPHNYWPTTGPRYPEKPGEPYRRPPAYMAYPPFREPNWRYEHAEPQRYYRGFHFWLDQF